MLFPTLGACLFVFRVGVEGDHPMSASIASERAMANGEREGPAMVATVDDGGRIVGSRTAMRLKE